MQIINVAICSFGMSGKLFHAPFIQANNKYNLYAVLERSAKIAQQVYPDIKSVSTLDELLQDTRVELIIVNTPNITHYEITKKCLLAGKHVVIEKPFCVSVREGQELIKITAKKNLKLSVYHNRRFDSDYKTVKNIIDQKILGDLIEMEIHYDRFVPALSYKKHKESGEVGTGSLYDLGSHLIDQALQLFGMPDALFADIRFIRLLSKVDDYFEVIFFYINLRVKLKCSYLVREPLPGYILNGSKGSFIKAKTNIQEEALLKGERPESMGWGIEPQNQRGLLNTEINGVHIRKYIDSEIGNYMQFYNEMYDAIIYDNKVPVSADDALDVIKIIELAFKSSKERRIIDIVKQ